MLLVFCSQSYEDSDDCVSSEGIVFADGESFTEFLKSDAAERLDDNSGNSEFKEHLSGLSLTGMGQDGLATILDAEIQEDRSWAGGEALAEAYLASSAQVVFPWNMEKDKRNPFGSLPGADIVGFIPSGDTFSFALGEVKTSSEEKYPPQVMSGRSGHIGHQIDELAHNHSKILQLLKWLLPRVKGGDHEETFNKATQKLLNSGLKDLRLFGVLVRDTQPEARDLSVRANALREIITGPTICNLIALYLPWSCAELIPKIREGGVS